MTDYKPTQYDVEWATEMIRVHKDNGYWLDPERKLLYQFDHKNKKLILRHYDKNCQLSRELHHRTEMVFGKCGYGVITEEDTEK